MFENCSIMVMVSGASLPVMRLELDKDTQDAICQAFSEAVDDLVIEKEKIHFDGRYKPEQDEFLSIENFQLADEIKDAIRNPLGVAAFEKDGENYPTIEAVFVGVRSEDGDSEKFDVAFQRFRKEQYISPHRVNLFFSQNTFRREKNFGISISDCVDCYYTDDELQFSSFYFARQIFDLSGYYRSATNQEVESFTTNDHLDFEDAAAFEGMANTSIRRKIAMINDSDVLTIHGASEIKRLAHQAGIDVKVANKKIIIPNDKEQIKIILGFLDEEAYKGPFTQATYLANSKRRVKTK